MKLRRSVARAIVALCVAAPLAAALVGVPAHAAAPKRSVVLSPGTGLGPGQFTKVQWKHFASLGAVYFRQCTLKPKNIDDDCTAIYADLGVSDASGAGLLYENLFTGRVPSATKGKSFKCDFENPCTLGVFDNPTVLSTGVLAKVTFAPTPSSCPDNPDANILGGGSSTSFLAMFAWGAILCHAPHKLTVGYTGSNSIQGMDNYIEKLTGSDFAVTGIPPSQTETKELAKNGQHVAFAPLDASGLVLAYKIFVRDQGSVGRQVTDLKLTPDLVARIFTGQISNWSLNEEINALNPKYEGQFPTIVRPMARADNAASTWAFTSWLSATAKKALPKDWTGPSTVFPSHYLSPIEIITGEDQLALKIARNDDSDYFEFGYIGYLNATYAHYYGLPIAKIQNAAGKFVTATPTSIDAAIKDAKPGKNGFLQPSYHKKDPKAYPMPLVDEIMVPTSGIPDTEGDVMRSFIQYAVGPGQSAKTLPAGYVPLPPSLQAQALAAAQKIPGSAGDEHTNPPPPPCNGCGGGGQIPPPGGTTPPPTPPPSGPGPSLSTAPPPAFYAASYQAPTTFVLPAILVFLAMGLVAGPLLHSIAKPGTRLSRVAGKVGARFRRGGGV
jgi:phosphate transport system substrate-binding protein